ncbi:MAG: dipeptide epimerase [Pseudonocardiales bacterium]|nr:MAG: dipeptide epimerase [Pseudonocardiales bacterium]
MSIREVRAHVVRVPLHTPFVTAIRTVHAVDSVLVEIVDGAGRAGWGEGAATWKVTGDSVASIEAAVTGPLRETVLGRHPDDLVAVCSAVEQAIVGNTAAKAAVDCALHDLAARRMGIPLPRLLGSGSLRVPTDVTLAAGPPQDMAVAAKKRLAEGFGVLKIKLGDGTADDVERLRLIRATAGPAAVLRVDANQGWTPRAAVRAIRAMEDAGLDLELVEQPVAAGDLDGLAFVTAHVSTPVLADESVWSAQDLLEIIRRRAADLVNVKLAKCGGIAPARRLLAVAQASGTGVLLGSMMETHVGLGAVASLATVSRSAAVDDLDAAWWLSASPVSGGLRYDGAHVVLPDAPGLGIDGLTS